MNSQLIIHCPKFQIKFQYLSRYILKENQRCLYHLSTNHKKYTSDLNKNAHRKHILINMSTNKLLMGQHVGFNMLRYQLPNNRNYSTQVDADTSKLLGIWRSFTDSFFVERAQDSLIWIHENSGLPWWGTIVLSAFLLRTFLSLPISIYTKKLHLRLEKIRNEMEKFVPDVSLDVRFEGSTKQWTDAYTRKVFNFKMNQIQNQKYVQENCHPFKVVILPLLNIPPWMLLSISIRKFCALFPYSNSAWITIYHEMQNGGFGWITNLTVPDPYFILPVTLLVTNLALCELSHYWKDEAIRKRTLAKVLHNGFRVVSIFMGCVSVFMPSGVVLFWTTISGLSLGQFLIMESTEFKKLMKIPVNSKEPKLLNLRPHFILSHKLSDNNVNSRLINRRNKMSQK